MIFSKDKNQANTKFKKTDLTKPTGEPESVESDSTDGANAQPQKKRRLKNDGPRLPFLKNKIAVAAAAVACAALFSFVLAPVVNTISKGKTQVITVAARDIPSGTMFDEGMFKEMEVPLSFAWDGMVTDPKELAGQYATCKIIANDPITTAKCSATPPYMDAYLHDLPKSAQAISISIKDFAEGLSGKLLPGDLVTVYASLNNSGQEKDYRAIQPTELAYVEILAVTTTFGKDLDEEQKEKYQETSEEQPQTTVTLEVNSAQAAALAGLNSNATVHLALACRGNPEEKANLLALQQETLAAIQTTPDAETQTE